MAKRTLIAAVAVLATGGTALAESRSYVVTVEPQRQAHGFEKLRVSKAALAGQEVVVWANAAIDPDCTEHAPGTTLTILRPPEHGMVRVSDEPFYLAYPPANPRSACNKQKIPGHQAFYVAAAGYSGRDRLVLEGASPEGRVREITVDIDVR